MSTSPRNYVVVCRGPNCRERGGLPLRKGLASLLRGRRDVVLVGYACFGQCEVGPNVAFFPQAEWFGGLADDQAAERVVRYAETQGDLPGTPLSLPAAERAAHVRNVQELIDMLERDASRARAKPWWAFWRGRARRSA